MFSSQYQKKLVDFMNTNEAYKSKLLNLDQPNVKPASAAKGPRGSSDVELESFYRFDKSGNIMISTTGAEKDISKDVKKVFQKVAVFLAAWTAALKREQRDLFDYEALNDMISASGLFVKIHKEERTINQIKSDLTLDTAIIESAIGAVMNPETASFTIAQKVLSGLGDKIRASLKTNSTKDKIAHMLFVCENLLGMPIVNISIFYIEKDQWELATSSNCHDQVSSSVNFKYNQETYMFVDPDYINENVDSLLERNEKFDALVRKISKYIQ